MVTRISRRRSLFPLGMGFNCVGPLASDVADVTDDVLPPAFVEIFHLPTTSPQSG
jgi:hypothetical protein